jgi:hypothetical protein
MIVDDNPFNIFVLDYLLKSTYIVNISEASNGEDAF